MYVFEKTTLTRRQMLTLIGATTATTALAACGVSSATAPPKPTASATAAPTVTTRLSVVPTTVVYSPNIYHLDLCVLAYHLYNQTLIFPMDPWHERLRGTLTPRRRDLFMAETHRFFKDRDGYRGPGSTRGWTTNDKLDPIISDYRRIDPLTVCTTRDDAKYRVFKPQAAIANSIKSIYLSEYKEYPGGDSLDFGRGRPTVTALKAVDQLQTSDQLYAFEGGTGATAPGVILAQAPAAWSLMGYVLAQTTNLTDGSFDVHIVFRGSQSGTAWKAALNGLLLEGGNADWVTDTDFWTCIADKAISTTGKVSRGFANSVRLCLNTIAACLSHINEQRGIPKNIYVTGHSLGGALAAQFSSAMILGEAGQQLFAKSKLGQWPWKALQLATYGCPTVGDKEFARAFNQQVRCKRIKVQGDPITQSLINEHVGTELALDGWSSPTTQAHEPSIIRQKLVLKAQTDGENLSSIPAIAANSPNAPWIDCLTFRKMMEVCGELNPILTGHFRDDMGAFVQIFKSLIPLDAIYATPITRASIKKTFLDNFTAAFSAPVASIEALRDRVASVHGVLEGADDYLGLCVVLMEVVRSDAQVTIDQVMQDNVLGRLFNT